MLFRIILSVYCENQVGKMKDFLLLQQVVQLLNRGL